MATRVIKTRIQNKLDTLEAWSAENPKLLSGEIAVVQTTEQQLDEATGSVVDIPVYLIKIGDGTTLFNSLSWFKTYALDVYDWAKSEKAEDVRVAINTDNEIETRTLKEWLELISNTQTSQDNAIALNTAKLTGHTDAEINTLIVNKLLTLNSPANDGPGVIKDAAQKDGKLSVTKGLINNDDIAELYTDKIIVTADDSSTPDTNEKTTLDKKLTDLDVSISTLKNVIAGGVRFVGITDTDFSISSNKVNSTILIINSDGVQTYKASIGDIVIQADTSKEFIWTGSEWQELGDQSRIGAIESSIKDMALSDVIEESKFVIQVHQTAGKIAVKRARPTSSDIKHGTGTVDTALKALVNFDEQLSDDLASTDEKVSGVQGRLAAVEDDYVRVNSTDSKIYVGKTGIDEIIFDCGSAPL